MAGSNHPCCCYVCDDNRIRHCPMCGGDPIEKTKTPFYLDVEFHLVCPCWCEQCFICETGTASYQVVSTPLHGYVDNNGSPTDPSDDREIFQTVRVKQITDEVLEPNPCRWHGRVSGPMVLRTYAGAGCGGAFVDISVNIKVAVTKLTTLQIDTGMLPDGAVDVNPSDEDWLVEAWAEAVDISALIPLISSSCLAAAGNPVSLVSVETWEMLKACEPSLASASAVICRIDCFYGKGPGCGCTQVSGTIDNDYEDCPARAMNPLVSPDPTYAAWWSPCDEPSAPGWDCNASGGAVQGGTLGVGFASHCCGRAAVTPCKLACPTVETEPCPECVFDTPEFIFWSWSNIGMCSCSTPVPTTILSLSCTAVNSMSGNAKRVPGNPCVWRCARLCGRYVTCNGPPNPNSFGPGLPQCPVPTTTVENSDCLEQMMIVLITRLATTWQVEITVDGVVVFLGTSLAVAQDCSFSSVVGITNTIPPCNPPVTNTPGGGFIFLSCDVCNCGRECRCDPDCCCIHESVFTGQNSMCGMPSGVGPWRLTWAASCSNQGVPGRVPDPCDCFGSFTECCNFGACGTPFNIPAWLPQCALIASGSETLCPDEGGFSASVTRTGFYNCGTHSFTLTIFAGFDPCRHVYEFRVSMTCCEDFVPGGPDEFPNLTWEYEDDSECPGTISGVAIGGSRCGQNCPGSVILDVCSNGSSPGENNIRPMVTFTLTVPPPPAGMGSHWGGFR